MKIKAFVFLLILFPGSWCSGQGFQEQFNQYFLDKDTANQRIVLEKWEKAEPDNPELLTSYFNYYFVKSKKEEVVNFTEKPENEKSFALVDSSDQVKAYLGSRVLYDRDILQKGIDKINRGIELYPDRLDMRFGKVYVYGQLPDWDRFTWELIRTIDYSSINHNNWTWTNGEMQANGRAFLLDAIQTYQLQLYNTGEDSLLINMRDIANEVLKYYPDHIESLSNLSVTYLLTKEYDKGLEPLLKAEKLNPRDYIVLSNIARAYVLKEDNEKAIEYYEKVLKHGDENAQQFARQQIEELKAK
jgi:hypothetical protein